MTLAHLILDVNGQPVVAPQHGAHGHDDFHHACKGGWVACGAKTYMCVGMCQSAGGRVGRAEAGARPPLPPAAAAAPAESLARTCHHH